MLDATELARRLVVAMDTHKPPITSVKAADECKVTPQAVNGWRKNGRIAKRHLTRLADLTGRPLSYFLDESNVVRQERAAYLKEDERQLVEKYRAASPRWRIALQHLAALRSDQQEEVSEGTMVLLAKAAADPVPDERVEKAFGSAPRK